MVGRPGQDVLDRELEGHRGDAGLRVAHLVEHRISLRIADLDADAGRGW